MHNNLFDCWNNGHTIGFSLGRSGGLFFVMFLKGTDANFDWYITLQFKAKEFWKWVK